MHDVHGGTRCPDPRAVHVTASRPRHCSILRTCYCFTARLICAVGGFMRHMMLQNWMLEGTTPINIGVFLFFCSSSSLTLSGVHPTTFPAHPWVRGQTTLPILCTPAGSAGCGISVCPQLFLLQCKTCVLTTVDLCCAVLHHASLHIHQLPKLQMTDLICR
jgi:hypothetical protein